MSVKRRLMKLERRAGSPANEFLGVPTQELYKAADPYFTAHFGKPISAMSMREMLGAIEQMEAQL